MANIRKIVGIGGTAYKITVTHGLDSSGKQVRHYKTFTPPNGMSDRRAEKEAQRIAVQFENEILQGYQLDSRQTFAEYADYVLDLKKRNGLKQATYERYTHLLERTNLAIGHIKLADLRPQHLNVFYKNLGEAGVRTAGSKATPKGDIQAVMKSRGLSMRGDGGLRLSPRTRQRGRSVRRLSGHGLLRGIRNPPKDRRGLWFLCLTVSCRRL